MSQVSKFQTFIEAESDLLNKINEVNKLLRAYNTGKHDGFTITKSVQKTKVGTINGELSQLLTAYKNSIVAVLA